MVKKYSKNSTKRDHRRANKEAEEREIKQTVRKLDDLYSRSRKLGMVKLDAPRFVGYVRIFRLKEQTRNRKDAHVLRRILDLVNTSSYCKKKDFSGGVFTGNAYGKYWACWRGSQYDDCGRQITKALTQKQFDLLNQQEQSYFYGIDWDYKYGRKLHEKIYRLKRPEVYYELFVKRFYIKEVPVLDSELESEISYYRDRMDENNWWPKYLNMKYGGDHRGDSDWNDRIRRFIFKTLPNLELKEHKDEDGEIYWEDHISPYYKTPYSE